MVVYGEWALRCSLSLSLKDLPNSRMYSTEQLMCGHLNLYIIPLFWSLLSLSIGAMRRVLRVLLPLKCTWIPPAVAGPIELLLQLVSITLCRGAFPSPLPSPNSPNSLYTLTPHTSQTPIPPISVAPSLVSTHS